MFRAIICIVVLLCSNNVFNNIVKGSIPIYKLHKNDTCNSVSPLPCSAVAVQLPYSLTFDAATPNTINDKNGQGTGFTTINNYSGTRNASDGQPSNIAIPGYEVSKIALTGGHLQLTANKGIDYLTNNNQLNVLGVQIAASRKVQLEVKIINPFNGTQSQQAGLWFGLNDKTFIKLSVVGNKVELRKELNDVSSNVVGTANLDQRITNAITGLSTKTVTLRMVIDSAANTAEGFYSTDGVNFINVGAGYPSASLDIMNTGLVNNVTYAGIYATYRNATTTVNYVFDDFSLKKINVPVLNNCGSISPLACNLLQVSIPFNLSFDAPVDQSITDINGHGTGFKTVNTYSGTRLALDGRPSIVQVPGYEPSKILLTNGKLQIIANKGIDYQTNNNQLNVLGVPVTSSGKLYLNVKVINPYNGTQSQQAGLWFGLNDKTYIKLGITGNKVELRREFNDITSGLAGSANPDQRVTAPITGLNAKTVSLRLVIDSATQTAEGFYSTDGIVYNSTGAVGYPKSSVDISGTGLTTGTRYAGLFATYRNATNAVTYTFDDFSLLNPEVVKQLTFSTDVLNFTVLKSGQVLPQSINLTGTPLPDSISLAKTDAEWLTLPEKALGLLQLGPDNINSNINPGNYTALVTGTANGYPAASFLIKLNVIEPLSTKAININFQDAQTLPPTNYLADYGQAFADRLGRNQGSLLKYGWRKRSDSTPLNLVGNGRNRNTPEDVLLATVFHMQANNISGSFQGVKTEGFWELKVPNGSYDVSVTVGDGTVGTAPEKHSINVEGVSAIANFLPIGKKGDIGRFRSATVRVAVADENLTINADGGINTKITNASIVPVSMSPYLYWASSTKNIVVKKGNADNNTMSVLIGNSTNATSVYSVSATYSAGATSWLNFNTSANGQQPVINFNYSPTKNLPEGTYYATVKAIAPNFTSADLAIQVSVVDSLKPYVISSNPPNGAVKVSLNTVSIAANNLHVPIVEGFKGGVDNKTLTDSTVKLFKYVDETMVRVPGTVQGTGGGDAISITPVNGFEPNTKYKFVITSGAKSYPGASFVPYETTFTTDVQKIDSASMLNAQFTKVAIPGTQNIKYSSLTIGPDDKFYALRLDGVIERYDIDHASGALSNKKSINTLVNKYGIRTAIGLAFEPQSTQSNLVLWVSHSSGGLNAAPAFDGNISRLQGDSLQTEQLVITKLPRSTRDHMINSVAFGPDGALYMCMGSNSSAGAYDNDWQRNESLLSGTVLRLDLAKLNAFTLPINVQTTSNQSIINNAPPVSALMSDGTYNPYSSESPLTIYASGVRNAYDLLWHSNGQLYLPTNGSGGGGNSPASVMGTRKPDGTVYNGPVVAQTTGVQVQNDWLFRVNPAKPVGYYGHPNPLRGEYVINRGFADDSLYSPSVVADANYRLGYNFGLNHSPDGVIEYKSNNFNGILKGKLLVCRFSGGGDIVVMEPGSKTKIDTIGNHDQIYDVVKVTTGSGNNGLTGMSGFANPLDIVEDVVNGNLYVAEFNWNDNPNLTAQITLLKAQTTPLPPQALLAVMAIPEMGTEAESAKSYRVNLANKGDGVLKVNNIVLVGKDAQTFKIANIPLPTAAKPLILQKNSSIDFSLNTKAQMQKLMTAKLVVSSTDGTIREIDINNETEVEPGKLPIDSFKVSLNRVDQRKLITYPNPNYGGPIHVVLKNFNKNESLILSLYDLMGNKLKSVSAVANLNGEYSYEFDIDRSSLNQYYIIRANYSSGSKSSKVIINK